METAPHSVDRAAGWKPLPPGGGPDGAVVFKQRCATCHDPNIERAPSKQQLAQRWPDEIVTVLTKGVMKPMAEGMSIDEIDAVATFLTGTRPPREIPVQVDANVCPNTAAPFTMQGPSWNGWSPDSTNRRFQSRPGFKFKDVPRLKVKWAFTYIGGRYGQATIVGGRLFTSSSSGKVYSLDAKTGCVHWRFDAPAGVRTTLLIGKNSLSPSGYAAYFGSYDRNYYAVDAATGKQLWEMNVEPHPRQVLTGSPVLHEDRLIVPISTWEEVVVGAKNYQCCTARGAVAALDIKSGKILWKTPMIAAAQPHVNAAGVQTWGPAGAAVWSAPTLDIKRRSIYVGTGNSFSDVPQDGANSIVALDLDTGAIRWKKQMTTEDNYLAGCPRERTETSPASCPKKNGPDHDFGASPFLMKGPKGRDILVAGQKSAQVYGLDPDTGEIIWTNKIGRGGALGGIEWGMTTEGKRLYVANADIGAGSAGLYALDPVTGKTLWATPSPKVSCAWIRVPGERRGTFCVNGNSQAPSMIPGAIFSGTIDGHLRAYAPETGKIIWDVDTAAATYQTVNGVMDQPGGALDAGGPTIADGMLYVISGYNSNMGGFPNNVLLAFSVDGK